MKKYLFILLAGFCLSFVVLESAQSLSVTMKRIVFEGPKRAEVLTIINNSNKVETYRIGWIHYVMNNEGQLVPVPKEELPPSVKPASDMIRYAPRRITVGAKSSQQIRIMMRLPAGVEDGEYRSHLWIRTEPDVEELKRSAEEFRRKSGSNQSVSIEMLPGITMPVIIRKGAVDANLEIQNLQASQSPGFVDVSYTLARGGLRSVYGDIDYVCNAGMQNEFILKKERGLGIYSEVSSRVFNFKAERPLGKPSCGNLTVYFVENEDSTRSKKILQAQATVAVPPQ